MTDIGFQYTIARVAIEQNVAGEGLLEQAREFALVKMAEEAEGQGYEARLDKLTEKRYHAKVEISIDPETGEELGDLVFLPDNDPEWTMLVVRWTCPAVVVLHDLKVHSLSIDPQPNAFGESIRAMGSPEDPVDDRVCRVCACTAERACVIDGVPCHWVADDLCSACEIGATP